MADEKHSRTDEYAEERRDDISLPNTGEPNEHMSIGRYLATRLSTLKPPMERVENPIKLLRMLNGKQWLFFLCAFIAWTWDGE